MEGYRVLTPSRPGYLRTPLEVGKTAAEQARAFSALLDTIGIKGVIVFERYAHFHEQLVYFGKQDILKVCQ